MQKSLFRKTPLSMSVAIALGAATISPALAQGTDGDVIEEIVALGIRGSLQSSANLKRGSQGVVDGIVAEDIGKFPDTNLAESMQRIAGVSIDRTAIGEGSKITVRGVGPDFNLVTLNGRQMPASGIDTTRVSNTRAFDFANLASEAVSAVEINKTSRASLPTGGIGATVNIRTARPLDHADTIASIGVKGVFDQSVDRGDSVTPEISGIFSMSNDDETFGVAVTGSYQDRSLGYNQASVGGYRIADGSNDGDWTTLPPAGTETNSITNRPGPGDIYLTPQTTDYTFNEVQRERINGQLALQFRPIETVTGTLDYTYSENQLATERSGVGAWYNFLNNDDQAWSDGPVAAPTFYSEFYGPGAEADLCFSAGQFAEKNENNSLGLNIEWDVSDRFSLEFDFHDSDAESGADSPLGNSSNQGVCGFFRGQTATDFSSEFPVLSIGLPLGADSIEANRSEILQTGRSFRNSYMKSEVQQAHISGELIFEDDSSLDFGILSTEVSNRSSFRNVQTESWGGFGTPADYPDEIWGDVRSTRAMFDNMPGNLSNIVPGYFDFNFEDVRQAGIAVNGGDDSTFRASDDFDTDRITDEDSVSAYLQYNRTFDIGNKPANIALGVRYEQTDVVSSAKVPVATGILWNGANEFSVEKSGSGFTTLKGDYDYVLPSIDFDVDVRDDMTLRLSYSETIGRPGWGDIAGGQTLDTGVRIDGGTGSQGDPGLLPLESQNLDISFEWYYGDASYASISYFHKDIDNYVGVTIIEGTPFNLPHPGQGARFNEAVAAVGNDFNDIRNYIFANYGNTPEVTVTGVDPQGNTTGTILGIAGEDPISTFDITVPANQQSAVVDGWEFSLQHMFGDSGFGGSVNFTLVDSDIEYDNNSLGEQFAIEGISDSANVVAFYEVDAWSARVAYNWRDEFLSARTDDFGSTPKYTDAYGQWDMNVSYNFNEDLSFFAEGINITDEIQTIHGRTDNVIYFATQTGARYMIGARYNFR